MLTLIREGDMSTAVHKLQKALITAAGQSITADGRFGPNTTQAVMNFQRKAGLVVDGIVGPASIRALQLDLTPTQLTEADYQYAAQRLGCQVATIKAFATVEAPNGGFNSQGEPTILYERHYFYRLFVEPRKPGDTVAALTAQRTQIMANPNNRDICWASGLTFNKVDSKGNAIPAIDRYGATSQQYDRLDRARRYSDTAGLMSASWGRFQIMGENGVAFGWSSVQAFHRAMQASERDHLDAFIAYILGRSGRINGKVVRLIDAVRSNNFNDMAYLYNGPSQVKSYGPKIQAAYNKYR